MVTMVRCDFCQESERPVDPGENVGALWKTISVEAKLEDMCPSCFQAFRAWKQKMLDLPKQRTQGL